MIDMRLDQSQQNELTLCQLSCSTGLGPRPSGGPDCVLGQRHERHHPRSPLRERAMLAHTLLYPSDS